MKMRIGFAAIMVFLLSALCLYGQEEVDSLVSQGIKYYDGGKYNKAIESYRRALDIQPDAPAALYELSITLIETKDYQSAIDYGNRLISLNNEYSPLGYNIKGSCLNSLKRTDEAIEVFIEGINKYEGVSLLHFNLALAYFAKKDFLKAKDSFVESIYLDPHYAGSHLNLARTMVNLGQWPEALLCFYYFLLLENNSRRAVIAYESIVEQLDIDTPDMALFITKTEAFIDSMKVRKDENTVSGFWADFYIPFFEAIADKAYMEDLCYYISLYFNKDANTWGKRNEARLDTFASWLENY